MNRITDLEDIKTPYGWYEAFIVELAWLTGGATFHLTEKNEELLNILLNANATPVYAAKVVREKLQLKVAQ